MREFVLVVLGVGLLASGLVLIDDAAVEILKDDLARNWLLLMSYIIFLLGVSQTPEPAKVKVSFSIAIVAITLALFAFASWEPVLFPVGVGLLLLAMVLVVVKVFQNKEYVV